MLVVLCISALSPQTSCAFWICLLGHAVPAGLKILTLASANCHKMRILLMSSHTAGLALHQQSSNLTLCADTTADTAVVTETLPH